MSLIQNYIEKTLKNDESALADFAKHVQTRAQQLIKTMSEVPQQPIPAQPSEESEPTA